MRRAPRKNRNRRRPIAGRYPYALDFPTGPRLFAIVAEFDNGNGGIFVTADYNAPGGHFAPFFINSPANASFTFAAGTWTAVLTDNTAISATYTVASTDDAAPPTDPAAWTPDPDNPPDSALTSLTLKTI